MQAVAQLSIQDLPGDVRALSPRAGTPLSETFVLALRDGPEAFSPIDSGASVHPSCERRAPPTGRGTEPGRWRALRASTGVPLVRGTR